jgi:hypothetical protein
VHTEKFGIHYKKSEVGLGALPVRAFCDSGVRSHRGNRRKTLLQPGEKSVQKAVSGASHHVLVARSFFSVILYVKM